MKYSVHNHWDPLKVCIVGRTYPPEFYSWINDLKTRNRFEKLAEETEEDYQQLINVLQDKFNVSVVRPEFPDDLNELYRNGKWVQPPVSPRDYFIMIQDKFWIPSVPNASHAWNSFYRKNKHTDWPDNIIRPEDLSYCAFTYGDDSFWNKFDQFKDQDQEHLDFKLSMYTHIFDEIKSSGSDIVKTELDFINGCFVSRLGEKMYFATQAYHDNEKDLLSKVNMLFPNTQNKIVDAQGHGDAVYCPVAEDLVISINARTYKDTFPDAEIIYLPDSSFTYNDKFKVAMTKNKGKWFIPGFENDQNLIHMVDHYFDEWVGQASETQFQVNILIVDPKNIIVSSHNDKVEKACAKRGIEVHIVPFRHKYFWDAGTHSITNDINREDDPRTGDDKAKEIWY